ncbi:zinc finger BED domain-containing protein RICESLEEPER 2-like [Ziziphus jujuba]|uniref:Zinc finger BED domain-containing protein RICESLEEPER 2-like n=1 Tax=Ziziphus jujuba TaxID=326968 RepID=A0ABM3ZYL6_ZIZJJ|nr:zinc finger BED domain-containing protein RICESLEEPER 2-like isoform X1 [Ziziphus jujuba]XP_060669576.1 zinc finger BED domain-containing protein RICESLEEPER 2-like [Ziziphus jujuba]
MDSKRGLRQDVPTRWNSTYLMLESALYYRRAFCHLELTDSNYKSCPSSHEWEKIEKISRFLGLFYDITCIFSGTKYPTSNLYFSSVFFCYVTLKENIESEDDYLRTMANQMLKKFEKYWSEFSLILAIAVVVDPRYKLQLVDWCYRKIYGASGSSEFIRVKSKLFSIFKEYVQKRSLTSSTHSLEKEKSNTSCGVGEDVISFRKTASSILKEFNICEIEELGANTQKSQLELYLEEPRMATEIELNVLDYWKANQFRYPEVASMARDLLSIPISTVASESAFSIGGRVLDQFRSSLKPSTVEAIVCTRDWLFGQREKFEAQLEDVTEDVLSCDINKEESSSQCSNYANTQA